MRVGSGGVMLPNHAPLMVAERFKVLEALYPGRIDLGLGRAPGTDPATSYALRRRQGISEEDDFLERFNELMLLETRGFPAGHPFHNVRAMPSDVRVAADLSSRLVGLQRATRRTHRRGVFIRASFCQFRRGRSDAALSRQLQAIGLARKALMRSWQRMWSAQTPTKRPSGLPQPSISISCAAPRANISRWLHPKMPRAMNTRRSTGRASRRTATRLSVGSPDTVKARLLPLIEATKADELMVTTMIFDHAARKRSYELLAKAFK